MSEPSFTCPRCGARSYNPNDIAEGYCGACHWWTGADNILNAVDPPPEKRNHG